MRAMILAAGLGTRLRPFTDQHPKALAMVNGKSLLIRNVEYLLSSGITDIIVNVHHFPDQIIDLLASNSYFGKHITISDESEEVLETGGGLMKASWFFEDQPFVLMNVDVLTDLDIRSMLRQHVHSGALATLAVTDRATSRYFLFDAEDILCGWTNIKTVDIKMSRDCTINYKKAFSGIHIISPRIFSLITFSGKFSMVDVYLELSKTKIIMPYDHSGSKFIDVGKPESIVLAERMFDPCLPHQE